MPDIGEPGPIHKGTVLAGYWDRYLDLGLERLHPIIPPGAAPASSWVAWWMSGRGRADRAMSRERALAVWDARVNGRMRGKIPGQYRGDGWQTFNAQGDPAAVYAPYVMGGYRWAVEHHGGGIGVNGTALLGLDIDVVEAAAAAAVLAACTAILGLPAGFLRRVGRAPKLLIPFRLAAGAAAFPKPKVLKLDSLGDGVGTVGAVEWLTAGCQWVMEGVHGGTGQPYAWPCGRLWERPGGLADLPEIDEDGAVGFLRKLRGELGIPAAGNALGKGARPRPKGAAGGSGHAAPGWPSRAELMCDEADARAMVSAVPNGRRVPREMYVAMAHHLNGCSGGAEWGRGLFLAWASCWPGDDPEYNAALWDGLSEPHTGWAQLAGLAEKHGWPGGPALRGRQVGRLFSNQGDK